jgi:hypothetical protein
MSGWAQGQGGELSVFLERRIHGRAVKRLALLTDEEALAAPFHLGALFQPCGTMAEMHYLCGVIIVPAI